MSRRLAIEPDLAGHSVRRDAVADVNDDPARDEAPVEAARVEGGGHLAVLRLGAAVEDVPAAGRLRRGHEDESKEEREKKALEHVSRDVVETCRWRPSAEQRAARSRLRAIDLTPTEQPVRKTT